MINNNKIKFDSEHEIFIQIIDNQVTKSYAEFKKLIRENYKQKNISRNRKILEAAHRLRRSTETLIDLYQKNFIWQIKYSQLKNIAI